VQQVSAPIVVSGPPRSGTTFTQELLSSHSRIRIHGQSEMWSTVWRWYQELCQAGCSAAKRNSSIDCIAHFGGSDECRCRSIIGRLWRDFITGYAENRPRWGWRAPWMCANPTQVEQLEAFWPDARWVVCIREPFQAWRSQRGTYAKSLSLQESIRRWIQTVRFAQGGDRARVFVMQVDRWSRATAAERQSRIDKLFCNLNEPMEPAVQKFVQKWPRVHHRAGHAELSPQQRRSVLEWFPNLPELMESMGYAHEGSH